MLDSLLKSSLAVVLKACRRVLPFCTVAVLVACTDESVDNPVDIPVTKQPNVLFIVADDLGYTDIGSFGSEIETPNIDNLAAEGVRFSRFYAASMCAPTRAMLLTGADNHVTGMGNMAEFLSANQMGNPGYDGHLNRQVLTLPELLSENGYHTYMVGKWHLGYEYDQSPRARGFQRSMALLGGGASHWDDMGGTDIYHTKSSYREDGELLKELPQGFYSTHSYTDKLISYIESNREDGQPFFAYAAYTSPHWPLHAPDDVRDRYTGVYDEGYDSIRAKRYQSIKELGLIPEDVPYPVRPEFIAPWESLSDDEKTYAARAMEVYAAMVFDLDRNIGRLISYLEENHLMENTMVVFMSDNGSDAFSTETGPAAIRQFAAQHDNSLENMGKRNSFNFIGPKWAHVGEAPFRLYKMMATEGGIRVPAIISYPGLVSDKTGSSHQQSRINASVASVTDLVPTVLDLAGIEFPDEPNRIKPTGRSLVPILRGESALVRNENDVVGAELIGRRAIIKGDWKIINMPAPAGSGEWELFNLETDPGEQIDLAASMPEKLAELVADWDQYVIENGVILPPAGPLKINHMTSPTR